MAGLLLAPAAPAQVSEIKKDERIVFFPTIGRRIAGQAAWTVEIHGCVYEPETRRVTLGAVRQALKLKDVQMTSAQKAVFTERARLFMADNERGNNIVVGIGARLFPAGRSGADGHFTATLKIWDQDLPREPDGSVEVCAILPRDDPRRFAGQVTLFEETGPVVISDIDDTIKVTDVTARGAMLRNTFLEPFVPVPGMPLFYRQLSERPGVNFYYLSASPWQLFLPLSEFLRTNGYPPGVLSLRKFRWKDESFFNLFEKAGDYKREMLQPFLKQFPQRQFFLIGDSGEQDPEVYAALARGFPGQVRAILIRVTKGEDAGAPRYRGLQLPEGCRLIVFRDPSEIPPL